MEDDIPTTGMAPALAPVTSAFSINPLSISRTPVRTHGDRTARNTSHRMAQDSQSQISGCWVQANWCAVERRCNIHPAEIHRQLSREQAFCQSDMDAKMFRDNRMQEANHRLAWLSSGQVLTIFTRQGK